MLKPLKLFLFFMILSPVSFAGSQMLTFKAGTWDFSTKNIQNSQDQSSGAGAYSVEYGYGLSRRFLFTAGFNILFTEVYTGSSGYGFDLGMKYFPLTDIGTLVSESPGAIMKIKEVWRPYVGLFLRQRTFNLAISSGYAGPGVSVGLDYAPFEKWFFSLEGRQDVLFGPGSSEATQTNILLGVGREL